MFDRPSVTGTVVGKIKTGLCEAQNTIRTASDAVGIFVVLTIVLPEADRTNFESSALRECSTPATRTGMNDAGLCGLYDGITRQVSYVSGKPFDALRVRRGRRASFGTVCFRMTMTVVRTITDGEVSDRIQSAGEQLADV